MNFISQKLLHLKEIQEEGKICVYGANGVIGYYDEYNHEDSEVAVTCRGAMWYNKLY